MIFVDLMINLGLLVALTVVSGFLEKQWDRHTRQGACLQGALFGGVAVLGMLHPLALGPGLFFDGRSMVISLCSLFFGPCGAVTSTVISSLVRLWIGGPGALTGVLVILFSAGIGLLAYYWPRRSALPSVRELYLLGLAVHVTMLFLQYTLPGGAGPGVLRRIGLPVIVLCPLSTILAGKILSDRLETRQMLEELQERERRYARLFNSGNDAVFVHPLDDGSGRFSEVNDVACALLGYTRDELLDLSPAVLDGRGDQPRIRDLETLAKAGSFVFEAVARCKSGELIPVEVSSRAFESKGERHALSVVRDITERKQAEEALHQREEFLSSVVENIPDMIFVKEARELRFIRFNKAGEELLGQKREELIGKNDHDLFPEEQADFFTRKDREVLEGRGLCDIPEEPIDTKAGQRILHTKKIPLVDKSGRPAYLLGISEDITGRKRAEEEREKLQAQLLQAQKMESVGRLAGGVAHDFNNMLGVILGHTELALDQLDPADPLHGQLQEIRRAAERSAALTRQLLAFARKQITAPKVLDLNETVEGMLKMLRRLIGEDIELAWLPGARLWQVRVDPSQIDQVLANLCVNARDAIAGVGRITIETQTASFDETHCAQHPGFLPGEYVVLAVNDDGCGMDEATLATIFEPFFTTKEIGKGTGLGLATVYGIVKQNDGFINVQSAPGRGTTFRVHLPRYVAAAAPSPDGNAAAPAPRGHETILLVEDEPAALKMVRLMLEKLGYKVLATRTPGEAMQVAGEHAGAIHLLLTDVVMPEMNGQTLAKTLLTGHPGVRTLFMSGYTGNVIAHHGVLDDGVTFLQKPFSIQALAAKVREVLDSP